MKKWTILSVTMVVLLAGCGTAKQPNANQPSTSQTTTDSTSAVSPAGDIPDSQAFVTYASASGHYSFLAPEGWARTVTDTDVRFVSKFNGVSTKITQDQQSFSLANVKANQVKNLKADGQEVKIVEVKEMSLPGGKAVLVKYNSKSKPNSVTNKQIQLENENFYFYKNGQLATLHLWAPQGADNVDQWKKMSESWSWK